MGNERKCIKVNYTVFLCECLCDKPGFVFFDEAISLAFDLENPLAAYNVLVGRLGYGDPGASFFKHGNFMVHGSLPI